MAKHRKTRQEKMIADQRHVVYHLEPSPAQVSAHTEKKSTITTLKMDPSPKKPVVALYAYVTSDLRKTAIVTSAIIIAQIFLFIFLNRI